MKALAIVLIVVGGVMMIITGINLVTSEKVVDLGKVEITKKKDNPISWSPVVGGILLACGAGLLLVSRKKA